MDFDLTDTEHALREGISALLRRHAGAARARDRASAYDHELHAALCDAGYLGMFADDEAGAVAATMLVEDVSAALGALPIGTLAIVAPALGLDEQRGPLVIARADDRAPVRYATEAGTALVVEADDVRVHEMQPGQPIDSMWGFPFARLTLGSTVTVLSGAGPLARAWWRLSLAAEIVGAVGAAFACTVDHLSSRVQFGRPLGSLQSLQHRLAALRVRLEGSRWLVFRAAWEGAPQESTATAAAHAVATGRSTVRDLHQMSGAIGLTAEYDLHLWTTRIHALVAEAGAPPELHAALARSRWPSG